jgi:glycosyltransferase involved in cell wall biosynthesis
MAPPSVTVVIPTRNRLALLREAVASVQAQTLPDWQLIIVDDASNDGTWDWLTRLADARTMTLRLENHSERSSARNCGLAAARSEFVLFLDDDDRIGPRALQRMATALERRSDAIAAVGALTTFDDRGRRQRHSHTWFTFSRLVWPDVFLGWVPAQGQCMFRTRVIRACGGFNQRLDLQGLEDYELWLKIARLGPTLLVPFAVLEYRLHSGQYKVSDSDLVLHRLRHSVVRHTRGAEREAALRMLQSRASLARADRYYFEGSFRRALGAYFVAFKQSRAAFWSPIRGPGIATQMIKSAVGLLVGRSAALAVRNLRSFLRYALDRQPPAARDVRGDGRGSDR